MKTQSIVILCALLGVILISLGCSCTGLKEGFDMVTQWKSTGEGSWDGPYSVNNTNIPNGWFFANNKSSPECCKAATYSTSTGCVCTTKEQLNFLNQRGGNRTIEDGF